MLPAIVGLLVCSQCCSSRSGQTSLNSSAPSRRNSSKRSRIAKLSFSGSAAFFDHSPAEYKEGMVCRNTNHQLGIGSGVGCGVGAGVGCGVGGVGGAGVGCGVGAGVGCGVGPRLSRSFTYSSTFWTTC